MASLAISLLVLSGLKFVLALLLVDEPVLLLVEKC